MKRLCLVMLMLLGAACDDMSHQPKAIDSRPSPVFGDNLTDRAPPAGTVARGQLENQAQLTERPAMDAALLARGQERYQIFCTPCHGFSGNGDGRVVQRGFSPPPAFSERRLREAPDDYLLQVIAQGHGLMYGYAARVPPTDRWAIVAHVRVLQLSQHAEFSQLPAALQKALQEQAK
jgi:mono/diheme cytochrome c family protein